MLTLNLHLFFCMITLILLLFEQDGLHTVIFALLAAVVETSLWARRERRAGTLNWCHPVPVFVLGYCIVYYQLPYCYFAGFELPYYANYVIFAPQNVGYCVLLAALGLSAFFCGEQISALKRKRLPMTQAPASPGNEGTLMRYLERISSANSVILLLTVTFFLLYLRSMGLASYLGFAYGTQMLVGAFSTHFGFLYTIFLYLAILLDLSRVIQLRPDSLVSYLRAWDKRILAVIVLTIIPFVLSGDRGSYLQPLALVTAPYFILVRPLRLLQAAVMVTILAFVLVVVGDTRGLASVTLAEALDERIESVSNPAQWPTMELANSFGTFNIATLYFPHKYEYQNGVKMLYSAAALIPLSSFFTDIKKKNVESDYVLTSSLFFTNILTQGTFSSGSGTSSLADIYMDFGPFGIFPILFIWGLIMAWISQKTFTTYSPIFVFLYAYYAYAGVYVNRTTFLSGLNNFIWVLLMFFVLKRLYLQRSRLFTPLPGEIQR